MVSNNVKLFFRALEFRALFFKGLNNGKEFFIIDFVITFLRCMLCGEEGDWAESAVFIILREYAAGSPVRGVSLNNGFALRVKVYEDGGVLERVFQGLEGGFALVIKVPRGFGLEERYKGFDDRREALNKAAVEVGK